MRPGVQIAEVVLSWVVTTGLTFLIVLVDERFMNEDKLERAWKPSSRDAAIVAFGPLCLLVHFIKTRAHAKSWRGIVGFFVGLVQGFAALMLVAVGGGFLLEGIFRIFGLPVLD